MKNSFAIGAIAWMGLHVSFPAQAFCLYACVPTEANAKAVFENIFAKRSLRHNEKYSVANFTKISERDEQAFGETMHMIIADVTVQFPEGANKLCNRQEKSFSFDKLLAIGNECNPVSAMSDPTFVGYVAPGDSKRFQSQVFRFLKTDKGWEGEDGVIY